MMLQYPIQMKVQITILVLILVAFGLLFVFTQKQSISNIKSFVNEPTISLPPDEFNAIPSPTPLSEEQKAMLGLQTTAEQLYANQASMTATIKTTKGDITIELLKQDAPFAAANFYQKVQAGFYNGLTFHRVEDWVIQGGDPLGDGTGGGQTPTELNQKPFVLGAVGYAASGEPQSATERISNGSQFFIVKQDAEHLNGKYSNFGQVVSGQDVVDKITKGDKILSITIQN